MCGFVGYVNEKADNAQNEKIIRAMADRIIHRGPDQDDYYVDGDVSLGFRRLSIIDLDGGSQPITNEDGSKVLVFNGEIYNFQPIREELIKAGHTFKTKTDSAHAIFLASSLFSTTLMRAISFSALKSNRFFQIRCSKKN